LVCHSEGGPYAEGVRECVLRKMFGCKRKGVTGKWRKLRNEKRQYCFPSSQSSIWVITSRRMRWAWHVARTYEEKRIWMKETLGRPGRRGESYIKLVLKYYGMVWTGLLRLRIGQVACCCEHGNEPPGILKCRKFID